VEYTAIQVRETAKLNTTKKNLKKFKEINYTREKTSLPEEKKKKTKYMKRIYSIISNEMGFI
jgi:hypothetical protein